jgi:hypothetical protein
MDLVNFDKYQVVEMAKLVPADWNYKGEDEEIGEKLGNNLKRNGQIENIIVRELDTGAYEVVNGNHRYFAMKSLDQDKIVAFNLGKVSTEEAIRIAIETNETKFPTDNVKLGTLMQQLVGEYGLEDLSTTMPYNEKTIELMTELPNFSWDSYGGSSGEGKEPTGDEEFETFKVRLPAEVKVLLEEAIAKTRASITRVTKRPCVDEIRPIECIALIIREMSDAALAQCLS